MLFYYYNEAYNKAAKHSNELVCFGSCNHAKEYISLHIEKKKEIELAMRLKRIKKKEQQYTPGTLERLRNIDKSRTNWWDKKFLELRKKAHVGIESGRNRRGERRKKWKPKSESRKGKWFPKRNRGHNDLFFYEKYFPILPLTFFIRWLFF